MTTLLRHPITTAALNELQCRGLVTRNAVRPTEEEDVFEMTEEAWYKLALENRPCTWCGKLMGYEVDPCTKDLCMDCAHPDGGDC